MSCSGEPFLDVIPSATATIKSSRLRKKEVFERIPPRGSDFNEGVRLESGCWVRGEALSYGLVAFFAAPGATFRGFFLRWAQLGRRGRQIAHPDQVVGRQREGEYPSNPFQTAVASLAQAADRLDPTEDLLDSFALLLTNRIAGMTGGARIDDRGRLAREMRSYLGVAHLLNNLLGFVPFVATQGDAVLSRNFFHHCHL